MLTHTPALSISPAGTTRFGNRDYKESHGEGVFGWGKEKKVVAGGGALCAQWGMWQPARPNT